MLYTHTHTHTHSWSQINNRAVAADTSPAVRRDALYFVLEQLEAFDEGEEDSDEEDVVAAAIVMLRGWSVIFYGEYEDGDDFDVL